ncbi:MAG: TIGR00282 family metallophosphoesterase [Acidobacteriota bacterium]
MNILLIADIVGKSGRRIVRQKLPKLIDRHAIDFIIANVENAAGGFGITPKIADELFSFNIDCLTSGNHIFDRKEIIPYLARQEKLLRPINYPEPAPGSGVYIGVSRNGMRVAVLNIMGRVFIDSYDCPFRTADHALEQIGKRADVRIIDFHAEATSEKIAFGWYMDGRVAAVIGTHTHVQTADERILPGGTAFISDAGMTGPFDSVIGIEKELAIERLLTQRPVKFETATRNVKLQAVLVGLDENTGLSIDIQRLTVEDDGGEPAIEAGMADEKE